VAVYERDDHDDAWNVHIEGLVGCQTYGRSLRQAQRRIRDALALWLDRDPDSLTIREEFPRALAEVARPSDEARAEAERAGTKLQRQTAARRARGPNAGSAGATPRTYSACRISACSNFSKRANCDAPPVAEILDQANELAARFEAHEPDPDAISDAAAVRAVRRALQARAEAERQLVDTVSVARAEGHSWSAIGVMLGTSGEAARLRYGRPSTER
jgi:hypothetical protein